MYLSLDLEQTHKHNKRRKRFRKKKKNGKTTRNEAKAKAKYCTQNKKYSKVNETDNDKYNLKEFSLYSIKL